MNSKASSPARPGSCALSISTRSSGMIRLRPNLNLNFLRCHWIHCSCNLSTVSSPSTRNLGLRLLSSLSSSRPLSSWPLDPGLRRSATRTVSSAKPVQASCQGTRWFSETTGQDPAAAGEPPIELVDPNSGYPKNSPELMKLEPDFGPNNHRFPRLPEIRNSTIEQQVFTHRSLHARPTHVFEDHPGDLSPDNERFEHLGDTVLGLVVTNLMFDLFPGLRVGPATKIRSLIVGNATLADISKRYRLPERLRLHPAQAITLRASTNIQADVFESFVGGLFRDQGLTAAQKWLSPLFSPFAQAAYEYVRKQHNLPPLPPSSLSLSSSTNTDPNGMHNQGDCCGSGPTVGHLALFNQQVQKANRQVEWIYSDGQDPTITGDADKMDTSPDTGDGNKENVDVKSSSSNSNSREWYSDPCVPAHLRIKGTHLTPVWYVKVLVDGEFYGRGRGNTKKAARNEAAKEGLVKLGIEVSV